MQVGGEPLALRQFAGGQLRDQVLESATVSEEPQVRLRAGGKQAAQEVERLRARGGLPCPVGLAILLRKLLADRQRDGFDKGAVGLEQGVGSWLVFRMRELGS